MGWYCGIHAHGIMTLVQPLDARTTSRGVPFGQGNGIGMDMAIEAQWRPHPTAGAQQAASGPSLLKAIGVVAAPSVFAYAALQLVPTILGQDVSVGTLPWVQPHNAHTPAAPYNVTVGPTLGDQFNATVLTSYNDTAHNATLATNSTPLFVVKEAPSTAGVSKSAPDQDMLMIETWDLVMEALEQAGGVGPGFADTAIYAGVYRAMRDQVANEVSHISKPVLTTMYTRFLYPTGTAVPDIPAPTEIPVQITNPDGVPEDGTIVIPDGDGFAWVRQSAAGPGARAGMDRFARETLAYMEGTGDTATPGGDTVPSAAPDGNTAGAPPPLQVDDMVQGDGFTARSAPAEGADPRAGASWYQAVGHGAAPAPGGYAAHSAALNDNAAGAPPPAQADDWVRGDGFIMRPAPAEDTGPEAGAAWYQTVHHGEGFTMRDSHTWNRVRVPADAEIPGLPLGMSDQCVRDTLRCLHEEHAQATAEQAGAFVSAMPTMVAAIVGLLGLAMAHDAPRRMYKMVARSLASTRTQKLLARYGINPVAEQHRIAAAATRQGRTYSALSTMLGTALVQRGGLVADALRQTMTLMQSNRRDYARVLRDTSRDADTHSDVAATDAAYSRVMPLIENMIHEHRHGVGAAEEKEAQLRDCIRGVRHVIDMWGKETLVTAVPPTPVTPADFADEEPDELDDHAMHSAADLSTLQGTASACVVVHSRIAAMCTEIERKLRNPTSLVVADLVRSGESLAASFADKGRWHTRIVSDSETRERAVAEVYDQASEEMRRQLDDFEEYSKTKTQGSTRANTAWATAWYAAMLDTRATFQGHMTTSREALDRAMANQEPEDIEAVMEMARSLSGHGAHPWLRGIRSPFSAMRRKIFKERDVVLDYLAIAGEDDPTNPEEALHRASRLIDLMGATEWRKHVTEAKAATNLAREAKMTVAEMLTEEDTSIRTKFLTVQEQCILGGDPAELITKVAGDSYHHSKYVQAARNMDIAVQNTTHNVSVYMEAATRSKGGGVRGAMLLSTARGLF